MRGYRPLKGSKKAKNRMALIVPQTFDLQRIGKNWFKQVAVEK